MSLFTVLSPPTTGLYVSSRLLVILYLLFLLLNILQGLFVHFLTGWRVFWSCLSSLCFLERGQGGWEQSELCPDFIVWHVTQRRVSYSLVFSQWGGGATPEMGCVCKSLGVPAGKQRLGILHSYALIWYDVVRCSNCCFFSPQGKDFISSMTEKCSMILGWGREHLC